MGVDVGVWEWVEWIWGRGSGSEWVWIGVGVWCVVWMCWLQLGKGGVSIVGTYGTANTLTVP
jgi:hypothetical protein